MLDKQQERDLIGWLLSRRPEHFIKRSKKEIHLLYYIARRLWIEIQRIGLYKADATDSYMLFLSYMVYRDFPKDTWGKDKGKIPPGKEHKDLNQLFELQGFFYAQEDVDHRSRLKHWYRTFILPDIQSIRSRKKMPW